MYKVVRKSEATVRQIADNKIALNYITKDLSPEVSLAVTKATDYYEKGAKWLSCSYPGNPM